VVSGAPLLANARDLEGELLWLVRTIDRRFESYFGPGAEAGPEAADGAAASGASEPGIGSGGAATAADGMIPPPPDLGGADSSYARFVTGQGLPPIERLALVLALTPHLRPHLLDVFHLKNLTFDRRFTEFGCARTGPEGELWPTLETLAFLLGGTDLATRFMLHRLLDPTHPFVRLGVLRPVPVSQDEPVFRAPLRVADDWLHLFTVGAARRPSFGTQFPAQHLTTPLTWDNLVLHPSTRQQISEIEAWIEHGDTLMNGWGMGRVLRPGYRSLFYGPPGTGKTMTACLLGKSTGRDIFKIDLALIVSKFIGETEKNLARVFDQAQAKGWILFFDEADALFGKRSKSRDAHDRYANQEVSFLLQRIETFDGITILASNFKDNIDDAFARRFESLIYFPMPRPEERLQLWRQGLPAQAHLDSSVNLDDIAMKHALSGGAVMNAIRHAALQALKEGGRPIQHQHLVQAIRREQAKEGQVV
jgi:hypothetical protein